MKLAYIERSSSKQVKFSYEADDSFGTYVNLTYVKTYPVEDGYPAANKGTLAEWEVKIDVSADMAVDGPYVLMHHAAQIALAVAHHAENGHAQQVLG